MSKAACPRSRWSRPLLLTSNRADLPTLLFPSRILRRNLAFHPDRLFRPVRKLAYIFYCTNFLVAHRSQWIGDFGHFWSLAIEEQFYLAFAPLVLVTPRKYTMSLCFAIISIGAATKIALEAKHASVVSIDVNSLVNFALLGYGGVIGLSASRPAPKWLIGGTAQCVVFCLYLLSATAFGSRPDVWPLFGRLGAVMVGVLLFQIFHGQQTGLWRSSRPRYYRRWGVSVMVHISSIISCILA